MARSTYLQVINKVKTLLREDSATSSTEDDYTTLIAQFVDQSLEIVQGAWDWSFLWLVGSEAATTSLVELDDLALLPTDTIKWVYNSTDKTTMQPAPYAWIYEQIINAPTATGSPLYYAAEVLPSSNGYKQLMIYPTPSTSTTIIYQAYKPQLISSDSTYLYVDDAPVVWMALSLALKERGEDGGLSMGDVMAYYKESLATAITRDSANVPAEYLTWTVK